MSITIDVFGGWVRIQNCLAGALLEMCLVGGCVFKTAWQEHYHRCVWWVGAYSKLPGRSITRDVFGGWVRLQNCLAGALPEMCLVGGCVFKTAWQEH